MTCIKKLKSWFKIEYPLLNFMVNRQIFDMSSIRNNQVRFTDGCDFYYDVLLNKKNTLRLAKEIERYANNELK